MCSLGLLFGAVCEVSAAGSRRARSGPLRGVVGADRCRAQLGDRGPGKLCPITCICSCGSDLPTRPRRWYGPSKGARRAHRLPDQRRVHLQGIGQVNVHLHRRVEGRVKTIQVKRQGRRWMLVLSCDDVPTKPLPATVGQVGIDVGVVTYATLSDGTTVANPRWARQEAGRLEVAQQRLQRAQRGSNNRVAHREMVAARHHKITNRRKDFHHKQARELAACYDLLVVEDLKIANMLRRAKPKSDPDNSEQFSRMVPKQSPG